MFAALLADKINFGDAYLNVIELRSQHLMRHMVAGFLLGRSTYQPELKVQKSKQNIQILQNDALSKIALPVILREKDVYSDCFTQFTEALFEDFDFDAAIQLADEMHKVASQDILLRPHATEIRRQALLYVFEVQAKLSKSVCDLSTFCTKHNIQHLEIAQDEVEKNINHSGLVVERVDDNGIKLQIKGQKQDVKGKILDSAQDLAKRTSNLNQQLQSHKQSMDAL